MELWLLGATVEPCLFSGGSPAVRPCDPPWRPCPFACSRMCRQRPALATPPSRPTGQPSSRRIPETLNSNFGYGSDQSAPGLRRLRAEAPALIMVFCIQKHFHEFMIHVFDIFFTKISFGRLVPTCHFLQFSKNSSRQFKLRNLLV